MRRKAGGNQTNNDSKCYVSSTDKYKKYLVNGMSEHNLLRTCDISVDSRFKLVSIGK